MTGEEQAAIASAQNRLAEVRAGADMVAIRNATIALDKATQRLAELMMDAAVSTALRGKTMSAAGEELDEAVTAPHPMAAAEFK